MARFEKGQSGNPKGRPPNGEMPYSVILRSVITKDRLKELVEITYEKAAGGDIQALQAILSRMVPVAKPTTAPVKIDLPDTGPADQCETVVAAMTSGQVSVELARQVIESIVDTQQLRMIEDLGRRLEKLEGVR